ncbi:MAG: glycosyltransferase [Roseiarcus sp.]|jgi:GT2 family glycosyltransferase
MPAVTIGVPVYNSDDLLDGSLACLAGQTFCDSKVLMIDDESTNGAARTTAATRLVMRMWRGSKTEGSRVRTSFAVNWETRHGFVRNLSRIRFERELSPTLRLALLAVQL